MDSNAHRRFLPAPQTGALATPTLAHLGKVCNARLDDSSGGHDAPKRSPGRAAPSETASGQHSSGDQRNDGSLWACQEAGRLPLVPASTDSCRKWGTDRTRIARRPSRMLGAWFCDRSVPLARWCARPLQRESERPTNYFSKGGGAIASSALGHPGLMVAKHAGGHTYRWPPTQAPASRRYWSRPQSVRKNFTSRLSSPDFACPSRRQTTHGRRGRFARGLSPCASPRCG